MKIYVIIGSTGEYSDRSEWPVCWRSTLAEAEQVVATCNEQAAEFKRWYDGDERYDSNDGGHAEEQRRRDAMLDPSFACDHTGTIYYVCAVCEDPREDKEVRS